MGNEDNNGVKAVSKQFTISISGVKQLSKRLKQFEDRATRKRLVNSAQRAAFKKSSMVNIAKAQTPQADRAHTSNRGGEERPHLPGNLKKSVGLITGKSKKFPNVQLGYRVGKRRKNDGWYGYMVHQGLSGFYGYSKPVPALTRAFEFRGSALNRIFRSEMEDRIVRAEKRYGLR